jgi:EmrB/QacA subfamily drug resistance transporter
MERRRGLILALCCAAQFMVVLDIAIVNVALPSIKRDLGLSEAGLEWIVIAYGLMLGGFLLLGGRLGDLLGRRRVLLAGLGLFTGASVLAGLSQSTGLLIAARALQGFGAALVAPSALSILAVTFAEGRERNKALGIFGAIGGSSASVGVLASGLLTDGPGWRWIFFINVPIGIALIASAARYLPVSIRAAGSRRFDALGAITVTAGLLLLVYGLNHGALHGWATAGTLGSFIGAAALLAAFVRVESRSRQPLVPFAVLRNRTMVAADLSAFLLFGAFFSFIFLVSLLLQQLLLYSPTKTGVAWLATSVTGFLVAGFSSAKLVGRFGVKRLLVGGFALAAVGLGLLTLVPSDAGYVADLLPALLLLGVSVGLTGPTVQIGAMTGVQRQQAGLASGLVETMREIGGAVGIAAVSTVLVSRTPVAGPLAGFHAAFGVAAAMAVLGAVVAAIAFPNVKLSPATVPFPVEDAAPVLEGTQQPA